MDMLIGKTPPPSTPKPKPPIQGWTDKLMSELPELRKGAKNTAVERAQALINTWESNRLKEDGDFGPATDRAVRAFQRNKDLEDDGIIGRNTWTKLVKG